MTIYTPDELDMFDLTWFAVDRNDEIAVFWTAGKGIMANPAVQTKEALGRALNILDGLRPVTEAKVEHRSIGFDLSERVYDGSIERQMARLGVYVYDHLDQHRQQVPPDPFQYVRLARPKVPLTLWDVPKELATILAPLRGPSIAFHSTEVIDVRRLECQT